MMEVGKSSGSLHWEKVMRYIPKHLTGGYGHVHTLDILLVIKLLLTLYIFQCVLIIISSMLEGIVSNAHRTVRLLAVLMSALVL